MVPRVPRIARGRKREIETRPADGELVRAEFAHDDGAGFAQLADADGILFGDVVDEDFRVPGGRQAGDIDDVLDADRNSVQRTSDTTGFQLGLSGPGGV